MAASRYRKADAMVLLENVVAGGFCPHGTLLHDPWLETLRASASFQTLVERVARCQHDAAMGFDASKGSLILSRWPV